MYDLKLSDAAQRLYDILMTTDFHYEVLEAELKTGRYSADDVNIAAFKYVDDSGDYDGDDEMDFPFGEVQPGWYSSHMYEALKLMLDYGLDPNKVYHEEDHPDDECNIVIELYSVFNGYMSADCLALLLEHGGNPCISVKGCNLVTDVYFDIGFWFFNAEDNHRDRYLFDAQLHFFMVLAGYGGHFDDGQGMVDMCKRHDVSELKNHRNFYYGGIESDRANDYYEICFFDKETYFEIGRY